MEPLNPSFANDFNISQQVTAFVFDESRAAVSLPFQAHRLQVLIATNPIAFPDACFEFADVGQEGFSTAAV